jgi:hypothetical protein
MEYVIFVCTGFVVKFFILSDIAVMLVYVLIQLNVSQIHNLFMCISLFFVCSEYM